MASSSNNNNNDQNDYAITSIPNNVTKRNNVNSSSSENNIALNESVPDVENKNSKQPKNTALKQQRLPAWQPVLTAKTVFPLFFGIGVVFIILGAVLLNYSNLVNELVLDYTSCADANNNVCSASTSTVNCSCKCTVNFVLNTDFQAPVYFYYGLKNFYQNHRRYVKSRDDYQLLGNIVAPGSLNSECAPYDKFNSTVQYAPCGAIANSLFNDTFLINKIDISPQQSVQMIAKGIAWTTDRNVKFQNPANMNFNNTMMPKNWQIPVNQLGNGDQTNTGYENEDLIVWMRTAALPSFRKFYRIVNHTGAFSNGLPQGNYSLTVCYNYPVTIFGGSKSFIISTTSWIGGKNPFLGIAYLVVGSTCVVLGCVFLIIHFKFSRNSKSNEEYNNNNNKNNIATVELPSRN